MTRRARKASRARANAARARARSRAAVRGWKTRRENALRRSLAAKKAARTRKRRAFKLKRERDITPKKRKTTRQPPAAASGERVDFLVSFQFSAGKKSYRRDLIVPASRGSSPASIIAQAKKELPRGADTLAPFLTAKNATIFEGPSTSRKRTEMR